MGHFSELDAQLRQLADQDQEIRADLEANALVYAARRALTALRIWNGANGDEVNGILKLGRLDFQPEIDALNDALREFLK